VAQQRCRESTSSLGSPTEDLRRVQRERRLQLPPSSCYRANLPLPAKIVSRLPPIEIYERRRIQTGAECIRTGLLTPGRRNDAPAKFGSRRLAEKTPSHGDVARSLGVSDYEYFHIRFMAKSRDSVRLLCQSRLCSSARRIQQPRAVLSSAPLPLNRSRAPLCSGD
jgi:hypothetical protein